ncbi:MAG TPA: metallophosphoesterase [Bacillaceae bacterium]|nr:metallophosphoesterase [Bacillaceae bacterium]
MIRKNLANLLVIIMALTTLPQTIPAQTHINFLENYTQLSKKTSIPYGHPDDIPREDYDFTLAWETDTQYYNQTYYEHQLNIHKWLIANRKRMNIQYLIHTGDIVNVAYDEEQWKRANKAYQLLDKANLPYGILAGNHDVMLLDKVHYETYYTYFGKNRFQENDWYGESFQNNRGHYDLLSIKGIDLLFIYMGWDITPKSIQWMNKILEKYPDKRAILCFHDFLTPNGKRNENGERIFKEVVKPNSNVSMVLSGHYHDANHRVDAIDDNGDGKPDRKVWQLLFDYQKLKEGGLGFIRLMHVDIKGKKIISRTYSPSINHYDDYRHDNRNQSDLIIPFHDLGISTVE